MCRWRDTEMELLKMKMVIKRDRIMCVFFFFCLLIISKMALRYYGKDVIEKSELARGTASSGLGIKARPVGRRGNCQCNREGKIALSQ